MFYLVSAIKADKRNRMELIIIINAWVSYQSPNNLMVNGKCCKDFVVTTEMLQRFNSNMYHTAADDETNANSEPLYVG